MEAQSKADRFVLTQKFREQQVVVDVENALSAVDVITSYSTHYTKLYDPPLSLPVIACGSRLADDRRPKLVDDQIQLVWRWQSLESRHRETLFGEETFLDQTVLNDPQYRT